MHVHACICACLVHVLCMYMCIHCACRWTCMPTCTSELPNSTPHLVRSRQAYVVSLLVAGKVFGPLWVPQPLWLRAGTMRRLGISIMLVQCKRLALSFNLVLVKLCLLLWATLDTRKHAHVYSMYNRWHLLSRYLWFPVTPLSNMSCAHTHTCTPMHTVRTTDGVVIHLLSWYHWFFCYLQNGTICKPQGADFNQIWKNFESRYPSTIRRAPRKLSLVSHEQGVTAPEIMFAWWMKVQQPSLNLSQVNKFGMKGRLCNVIMYRSSGNF